MSSTAAPSPTDVPANVGEIAAVLGLGLLRPAGDLASQLAAVAILGAERSAELLIRHKVARIGRRRLLAAGGALADATAERLRAYIDPLDERLSRAGVLLELITNTAAAHGFVVRRMKGFSQRDRYPDGMVRDVGDIDLLVADFDAAWTLADAFLERGYLYPPHELPWFKGDLAGGLYGQVRLVSPGRVELPVDIHVGPYSVRHCGLMPLGTSLSRPTEPTSAVGPAPVDPLDDLCYVIGNAAGDCFIDAKTVNDLVVALADMEEPTRVRPALHATLDSAALLPFFASCLDRVLQLSAPDIRLVAAALALRPDVEPEEQPPLAAPDDSHRTSVTIAHAAAVADRVPGGSAELTAAVVAGARRAYGIPTSLRVAELPYDDPRRALPQLVSWNCVRLVPGDQLSDQVGGATARTATAAPMYRLSARTSVLATPEGELVDAGRAGIFVPTIDFLLPAGLAVAAASHR